MARALSNLVVLALIIGGAYALWNWQFGASGDDGNAQFAERSCSDEVRRRFDVARVQMQSVRENSNGYVVRGSMTLARGPVSRVTCLTNRNGRVLDVMVDE